MTVIRRVKVTGDCYLNSVKVTAMTDIFFDGQHMLCVLSKPVFLKRSQLIPLSHQQKITAFLLGKQSFLSFDKREKSLINGFVWNSSEIQLIFGWKILVFGLSVLNSDTSGHTTKKSRFEKQSSLACDEKNR